MHCLSTCMLLLLHSAFMLSLVKMLLKGEVGDFALNSHGNYIVDHGKSWKNHGIVFFLISLGTLGCDQEVEHCESLILYHKDLYIFVKVSQVTIFYSSLDTFIHTNTPTPKEGAPMHRRNIHSRKKESMYENIRVPPPPPTPPGGYSRRTSVLCHSI